MQENREEFASKKWNEYVNELKLDINKEYSIDEVKTLLDEHHLTGGVLKFVPTKVHTGKMILETLVYRELIITDAIHKNIGIYEDKSKCENCGNYYNAETDRMFQVDAENTSLFLCEKCRRELRLKIGYYNFSRHFTEDSRKEFIVEEAKYGLDYSDYMERINKNKDKFNS